jgi:hypothetical protein
MKKIQLSKKTIAMACMFALALAAVVVLSVPAKTQDSSVKTPAGVPSPRQQNNVALPPPALMKHVLGGSFYDTTGGASASCAGAGCFSGPNPIFLEAIVCPGAVGVKCTYEVQISGQASAMLPGDTGLFQFLVDGAPPTGGGTDPNGFYSYESDGAPGAYSLSYEVVSTVTNAVINQAHRVDVFIACSDTKGLGSCTGSIGFGNLIIRQSKP